MFKKGYAVLAFRPNGNFEVFEVSKRAEAKAKKKELLDSHNFLIVKIVKA